MFSVYAVADRERAAVLSDMVRSLLLHRQLFYEARQLSAAAHRLHPQGTLPRGVRGEFHVAEAGDVLLLDCIEPHYYHAEDGLEFVYMHFEGSNARELCRRITDRHGWLIRRDNNTLIGNLLYDMVRFYDENGVETDMQRSARIYRMFDLLLSPSAAEQSADTPVEQAIQYIRSHIGQPISVEELASTVCLSASYFAHMFKRHTGFSPADYVINSRIERAKVLLVRTQKPIAEIAEEVGYSTSGSLINLFVKKVGTSPRQYRIRHMSKAIDAVCKTDVPFIDTDVPEL